MRSRSEIRGRSPREQQSVRQARAGPLLIVLHEWFKTTLSRVSRKSEIAATIGYALARWSALVRCCDDGQIEIDNNAAERALHAAAVGRMNSRSPDRIVVKNAQRRFIACLARRNSTDSIPTSISQMFSHASRTSGELDCGLLPWNLVATALSNAGPPTSVHYLVNAVSFGRLQTISGLHVIS
jgi:Transposase IS66 family